MPHEEREKRTLPKRIAEFIKKGKTKHGEDTYDYSLVPEEYINNRTPVHIKCNRCNSESFLVYPFAHTCKGDNQKGTCENCYIPKQTISDTRWNPNLPRRISKFKKRIEKKYGKSYCYPNLEDEYKNEESYITVVCNGCDSEPYQHKARSLKSTSRKGGCKICTKEAKAKEIAEKNKVRLTRNHHTQDLPRPYGCIYKITNRKNRKFYIGYTTMSAQKRFKAHCDESKKLAKGNKKAKSYLHSAINHHGLENFIVEILEEFTDIAPIKLCEIEVKYISFMDPQYNVSPGGELGHYKTSMKKAG